MPEWANIYERLKARIEASGVQVLARRMPLETTGIFDGLTITTNTAYDLETRCYNIAHSFGHIVQWSLDLPRFQSLYDTLHAAKLDKQSNLGALIFALVRFRQYEEEASSYAAWLLIDSGHPESIPGFTNFARADLEAIIAYHHDGHAPYWHHFFAEWNAEVSRGELQLRPFEPKPIPVITPIQIEPQEVIQEVESESSP